MLALMHIHLAPEINVNVSQPEINGAGSLCQSLQHDEF